MSSKDYANRRKKPATKKRSAAKSGKAVAKNKKRIPVGALTLFTLMSGGFGYLLYQIKGDHTHHNKTVATPSHTSKPAVNLPEPPKEKWSYLKDLPKKEVKVKIDTSTKPSRPYKMQCGSFRHKIDAEAMQAKIAFQGLSAQVQATQGKKGMWYRVVLGPYPKRRATEVDRHKLQRVGIDGCKVWYWN